MPPYNKDDSELPPLSGVLYEHIEQPPLNFAVSLVPFLRRVNGGNILNGDRPISENSRFDFTFIFVNTPIWRSRVSGETKASFLESDSE